MNKSKRARAGMIASTAVMALAVTGMASAATASAAVSPDPRAGASNSRPIEEQLTGTDADKVRAAVLAKYPTATIDRMEKDADGGSVFEAHITKTDGTRATVLLNDGYQVTGEQVDRGRRGQQGQAVMEEQLTGTDADKVRAAVLAKYPTATIDRMEKDADEGSSFEAYVTKTDGSRAKLMLDANFTVTAEKAPGGKGGGKGGHRHGTNVGTPQPDATGSLTPGA